MPSYCLLLADNDDDYLLLCRRFLAAEQYQVHTATSPAEARRLLETARIHLAILDLRLIDDDEKDRSGLMLAKEAARSVPKLILTKYPTQWMDVREALRPDTERLPPAVDFVDKGAGLPELLLAIEAALRKHVRINWDLSINWTEHLTFGYLVNLVEPEISGAVVSARASELEDLFRALFYEYAQINIGRLLAQGAGRAILEVFAYRPGRMADQLVVICGQKQAITNEQQRFEQHAPGAHDASGTSRVQSEETLHFGATTYTLDGGDLERVVTFRTYYQRHTPGAIVTVLDALFRTTLLRWYAATLKRDEHRSLVDHYVSWLELDRVESIQGELERRGQAICQATLAPGHAHLVYSARTITLHLPDGSSYPYANPAAALKMASSIAAAPLCAIVHGKLHPDGILIEEPGEQAWLVDFSAVDQRPLFCDFVWLETMIRTDLLGSAGLQERFTLEQHLHAPAAFDPAMPPAGLSAEVHKALSAIAHIRSLAAELPERDFRAYQVGLLICALHHLLTYDPRQRYERRTIAAYAHSLLLAAMLYHRLAPPAPLPAAAYESIWIDDRNQEVWVGGRQASLSPQEFSIFAYLYRHAGDLCTRQDIAREAMGFGAEVNSELIDSSLNSAINRLRQEIEPDSKHPDYKYILTVRGRGYKLLLPSSGA